MSRHNRSLRLFITALALALVASVAQAGPMSDYLEGQIIKYWFQNDGTAVAKPATMYVGLSTTACSDSSFGTEVSGGSYARVALTSNATNWPGPTANNGTVTNGIAVTFPAPTANWGSVGYWFIADASSAGNLLWCAALTTAKTINNGDAAPSFGIGALSVQVDN
jgi:hypothetical protein